MEQDELLAALERLLEPEGSDGVADSVVPHWAFPPGEGHVGPRHAVPADLAPDLEAFLSDGFAGASGVTPPSIVDISGYLDGLLRGAERDAFEAALVASPDLRAEVEVLSHRLALVAPGSGVVDLQGEEAAVPRPSADRGSAP